MVEGYLIPATVVAGTEEVHGSTRPARRAGTQIVGATKGVARAKQEFVALSLRFR